tara:strand:+ start:7392 stop:7679 length:288 start_codon:yes stop_codon:yes gene_type:complete
MTYLVSNTSALEIVQNNSSGAGEITIELGLTGPNIIITNATYVGGVYGNNGKKNPGMPYCEVNEKIPNFTDEMVAISSATTNQITLNLDTNINQI